LEHGKVERYQRLANDKGHDGSKDTKSENADENIGFNGKQILSDAFVEFQEQESYHLELPVLRYGWQRKGCHDAINDVTLSHLLFA
jgi:hypothetical protein